MSRPHGHFSTGQERTPHSAATDRAGHFSEGQERAHEDVPTSPGHFSEGQERAHEDVPTSPGNFGTGQEEQREHGLPHGRVDALADGEARA